MRIGPRSSVPLGTLLHDRLHWQRIHAHSRLARLAVHSRLLATVRWLEINPKPRPSRCRQQSGDHLHARTYHPKWQRSRSFPRIPHRRNPLRHRIRKVVMRLSPCRPHACLSSIMRGTLYSHCNQCHFQDFTRQHQQPHQSRGGDRGEW